MITDEKIKSRTLQQIELDLGVETLNLIDDPKVVEIMLNSDGKLWVEKLGEGMVNYATMPEANALSLLQTVASFHGKIISSDVPILECEFPLDGSRFTGQVYPCVPRPTFTLRKKAISIFSLQNYVDNGVMTERQKYVICQTVKEHKNILVIGGTGSGKTTLVNAVIGEMVNQFPNERVVIIEDTGEIQCAASNYVQFHTTKNVTMTDLLKTTLRMRPDRILVGEVRGKEALDLLMAWNTGHSGGAATVHANNCNLALERIAMLISMNQDYPKPIEPLIASAVNIIIHISRAQNGREIKQIMQVNGFENGKYITTNII